MSRLPPADLKARRQALAEAPVVLVSACLLGAACRYDARAKGFEPLSRLLLGKEIVPICPEAAAGLGTPRPAVELVGGEGRDVWSGRASARTVASGEDRTGAFIEGARIALAAARRHGATVAILKERSPSCGSRRVYVEGALREGEGITAALLREHGLVILSEEEL